MLQTQLEIWDGPAAVAAEIRSDARGRGSQKGVDTCPQPRPSYLPRLHLAQRRRRLCAVRNWAPGLLVAFSEKAAGVDLDSFGRVILLRPLP